MAAPKGNTNAKKAKAWCDAIHMELAQDPKALRRVAKSLISKAQEGDMAAIKELGDRIDGKAVQSVEGNIEQSLTVEIMRYGKD